MRVPCFLLLMGLPGAAAAQDASRHDWGIPTTGGRPSAVSVERCPSPCFAVVTFDNTLVTGAWGAAIERATLSLYGVPLAVSIEQSGGAVPDRLRVLPPMGYMAEPGEVLVDDGASGTIEVAIVPMS